MNWPWPIGSPNRPCGYNQMIAALLEQALANVPEGRIESLAYDKAADDEAVHRLLHKAGIKPLIQNRALWEGEARADAAGTHGAFQPGYDESGKRSDCYDKGTCLRFGTGWPTSAMTELWHAEVSVPGV